ncbi:M23 family metallopeptidase [Kordia sp.]|uniref:M23 family metallopeptidase n=1 Tax=Kordia sp. TaxID=1965332 RepID=UPI003D2E17E5
MKSYLYVFAVIFSLVVSAQEKQPVESFTKNVDGRAKVFGKNNTSIVYSAIFKISGTGCKPSKKLPVTVVLPPNSEIELYDMIPLKNKKWNCGTNYTYVTGNVKAKPNRSFVYDLPYDIGSAFKITQGYFGKFSHQKKYSLDFIMPEGTPIHAIRAGTVIKIKKDSNTGCPTKKCVNEANYIWITHKDGTIAEYAHLQFNGTHLKVGDTVKKGEKVGLSGNTGFSENPHLHLEVFVIKISGEKITIQTKFRVANNKSLILKKGDNYTKL